MHVVDFDARAVRAAFRDAAGSFVELVRTIDDGSWDDPALGVWSVRSLVGHASRAFGTVVAYLGEAGESGVEVEHPLDYFVVLGATYADDAAVAERGRRAGLELGPDPVARIDALRDEAFAALEAASDDAPVATPAGTMRLIDYLPSRVFELTMHSADLAAVTGQELHPSDAVALLTLTVLSHLAVERGVALDAARALGGRRPLPDGFTVL